MKKRLPSISVGIWQISINHIQAMISPAVGFKEGKKVRSLVTPYDPTRVDLMDIEGNKKEITFVLQDGRQVKTKDWTVERIVNTCPLLSLRYRP